jgi:ATP-dependent Lon protease
VPADVRDRMQFHVVTSVDEVLALALESNAIAAAA